MVKLFGKVVGVPEYFSSVNDVVKSYRGKTVLKTLQLEGFSVSLHHGDMDWSEALDYSVPGNTHLHFYI